MSAGPVTLTIERLGAQGDGIATHDGRQVFTPLTLPGETITAEIDRDRARVIDIITPSPDRVGQRCAHYGECGGCSLQHIDDETYHHFKRDTVLSALEKAGVTTVKSPADLGRTIEAALKARK